MDFRRVAVWWGTPSLPFAPWGCCGQEAPTLSAAGRPQCGRNSSADSVAGTDCPCPPRGGTDSLGRVAGLSDWSIAPLVPPLLGHGKRGAS